jgi:hypothetical protein
VLRLVHSISEAAVDEHHEVVFETADEEVAFVRRDQSGPAPVRSKPVLGTIRGRVQTLQPRTGLRFVLYDLLHDKAVTCYLTEDQEDLMRDAWGRMVEVTGMITHDEITDRPRAIRRVADVQVLEEGADAFAFRRARGAISSEQLKRGDGREGTATPAAEGPYGLPRVHRRQTTSKRSPTRHLVSQQHRYG